eukprot:CAMPEP_0198523070 /NCGR_PEP_ID=MMETSP1462-20131121/21910_1 /TAXON_ID=1333877 /ORGANISM="Brandtodinium nutriculum, Strain RCC3387" /LENGTH=119 /DNA_ID=CAMNT_0044252749 /DNA_START=182 /DNA_END=541 /DNA_ORIENTATION=+
MTLEFLLPRRPFRRPKRPARGSWNSSPLMSPPADKPHATHVQIGSHATWAGFGEANSTGATSFNTNSSTWPRFSSSSLITESPDRPRRGGLLLPTAGFAGELRICKQARLIACSPIDNV